MTIQQSMNSLVNASYCHRVLPPTSAARAVTGKPVSTSDLRVWCDVGPKAGCNRCSSRLGSLAHCGVPCFGSGGSGLLRRQIAVKRKRRACARDGKSQSKKLPGDINECGTSDPREFDGQPIIEPDSQVREDVSESIKEEKEQKDTDCGCIFTHCGCPKPELACRARGLLEKAKGVLRHLRKFYRIRSSGRILPDSLNCLSFRQVIRRQLPEKLTLLEELTVKTASKIVKRACKACREKNHAAVGEYKKRLFTPVEVNEQDLKRFKLVLGLNVPQDWNTMESPYIPNGHASLFHERKQGGNWREEHFSEIAGCMSCISSGKPRIVTTYSSYNTEVLTPLHRSLYAALRRKGWLLVGPPTSEKVKGLNGSGPLMSYDYESATDNIKADYVRAAVQVLKEKAVGLTDDQVACLDVVGNLRFDGSRHAARRGQPMGSLMSFPLLCLINKTIVDLSLTELLEKKKMRFKEWAAHRCLINGDDLLLRSPLEDASLYDEVHRKWSASVGMKVNKSKTLIDNEQGEINSTLFVKGEECKKSNLSALYMSGNTDDVVGVAYAAATSVAEFRRFVSINAHLLARQSVKFPSPVPLEWRKALLGSPRVRRALKSLPAAKRPVDEGTLGMVEKPEGYDLSVTEECKVVKSAVERARSLGLFYEKIMSGRQPDVAVVENAVPLRKVFDRQDRRPVRELVLRCLATHWELLRKEELRVRECESQSQPPLIVSDDTRIGGILDAIRAWKSARLPCRPLPTLDVESADGHVTEAFFKFA
jgi:hypothetical protein